jgi:hypothetical protein
MDLKTTAHVKRFVADQVKRIAPDVALFDTV